MFVELIEFLRCPRRHEDTPLIVSAHRTAERHIVDGLLGCPVCHAEFRIIDGIAHFGTPEPPTPPTRPDAETAMRLAAFLELTDASRPAILCGRWGAHADHIRRLADAPLVLVNPPDPVIGDVASVIRTGTALPLAAFVARSAALDHVMPRELLESVVRAVRSGGRVVGPATMPLPADVRELVRDDRMWVGEKTAAPIDPAPRLVSLERA